MSTDHSEVTVFGSAERLAAVAAGNSSEMDALSKVVLDAVRANASSHTDTGDFEESIKLVKSKRGSINDRAIITDDDRSYNIEFGWTRNGKHHEGIHVFSETFNEFYGA